MTFYKDGRKFDYEEAVDTLNALTKENILPQLEEKEVEGLFMRFFEFIQDQIIDYLKKADYKIIDAKQCFLTLVKLKVISDEKVWNEAIKIKTAIDEGQKVGESLPSFMSEKLLPAMKELKHGLDKK